MRHLPPTNVTVLSVLAPPSSPPRRGSTGGLSVYTWREAGSEGANVRTYGWAVIRHEQQSWTTGNEGALVGGKVRLQELYDDIISETREGLLATVGELDLIARGDEDLFEGL